MKRAVFYLTFNGIFQNTNGIGRQTATILGTVERHWSSICRPFGSTSFFVITPTAYNESLWGCSYSMAEYARGVAESTGGTLNSVPVSDAEFWTVATWSRLCQESAKIVVELSRGFSQSLVFAVDAPFLQIGAALEAQRGLDRLDIVHCPYSSYHLSGNLERHSERELWETEAYRHIRSLKNAYVGDVCRFMTRSLSKFHDLATEAFVPFESSLDLEAPDFDIDEDGVVARTLCDYGIPLDQPLLLAFGRAHPIKGLDVLLEALHAFPEHRLHLVMLAVPYPGDEDYSRQLRNLATQTGLGVTFVDHYDRVLPRALAQWQGTRIACCPSRLDTLPNVPMEIALWARHGGPVVVASDAGGISECVDDGVTGYLFKNGDVAALRSTLRRVLSLQPGQLDVIRAAAHAKVCRERNQRENLTTLLNRLWAFEQGREQ